MTRPYLLLALALALLLSAAGCAEKHHAAEINTSWISDMAVVVSQEAGQPLSLTLVESEVTRHLYRHFRLVTASQLAATLGQRPFMLPGSLDPETCAEIERLTGVDAILQVTVTGHEIGFSSGGEYRAHVALAMQLIEASTGIVRWSRSARRSRTSDTISEAVNEAVSSTVWDCLKYLIGYDSIVQGESMTRVCSQTGLTLDPSPDARARAGLQSGDTIARVNGRPLDGGRVEWTAGEHPGGVSLTIKRDDTLIEMTVPLREETP
jgi:hypothetical protein